MDGNGLRRVVVMMMVLTMFVRAAVEANGNVLPQHLIPSALPDSSSMFAKLHLICYADCVEDCGIHCLAYYAPYLVQKARIIVAKCHSKCVRGCATKCMH
jgi:hypothetical protein